MNDQNKRFHHVMVDLETFASSGDAAIVSIGAVCFDPETGELGPEFKINVDPADAQRAGGHVDAGTVLWWFQQTPEARARLTDSAPRPLVEALARLNGFFLANLDTKFCLWGNGSDFDNIVLRHAYASVGIPVPWHFGRNRCYRTMKGGFPEVPMQRKGTHHDALDDARSQARHLCAIYAHIRRPQRK